MAKVRILRLLEYIYDNQERAEEDQKHWQIPAIETRQQGNTVIKSTILTDLNWTGDNSE